MNRNLIVKFYKKGKTCQEIANKYKMSRNTIAKILKERNIKTKGREGYHKYKFNQNYFNKINTPEKAYWLGWLFSDGYNNVKKNTVTLQIQARDVVILKNFIKDISYNGPIRDGNIHKSKQKLIFLTSKIFSKTLSQIGCVQRKSLILTFPNISKNIVRHFIRGYFDGDGCISGKNDNFQFTIIGTQKFCNKLNSIFSRLIGKKKLEEHPNGITKRYRVSGKKQILKLYHYLYKNSTRHLNRKKKKMEKLLCIF